MEVPRFVRTNSSRLRLEGNICPDCEKTFFPPRNICDNCNADVRTITPRIKVAEFVGSHGVIYQSEVKSPNIEVPVESTSR